MSLINHIRVVYKQLQFTLYGLFEGDKNIKYKHITKLATSGKN